MPSFHNKILKSDIPEQEKESFIKLNSEIYFPAIELPPIQWLDSKKPLPRKGFCYDSDWTRTSDLYAVKVVTTFRTVIFVPDKYLSHKGLQIKDLIFSD